MRRSVSHCGHICRPQQLHVQFSKDLIALRFCAGAWVHRKGSLVKAMEVRGEWRPCVQWQRSRPVGCRRHLEIIGWVKAVCVRGSKMKPSLVQFLGHLHHPLSCRPLERHIQRPLQYC